MRVFIKHSSRDDRDRSSAVWGRPPTVIGTSALSGAGECSKPVDKFNSDGHVSD